MRPIMFSCRLLNSAALHSTTVRVRNRMLWAVVCLVILTGVLDAIAHQASAPSQGKGFDGPAELPRQQVRSSFTDTPAGGKVWMVRAGGSFQQMLANASCGDVIQLEAGASFSGNFELPQKNCDVSHLIIIRTSAPDSSLPPEGTRLTPCYAGIAGLPGRPAFPCSSARNVLAKIEFDGKAGSGPITFAPSANHYRLIGLEVTRGTFSNPVYNLILFKGAADHVIFDRLWLHGSAQDETARGIGLAGTNVAV